MRPASLGPLRDAGACPRSRAYGIAALVVAIAVLAGIPKSARAQEPPSANPPAAPLQENPEVTQCLRAHEGAQEARIARRFDEARTKLRACATKDCPGLVRADCVTWLADLEKIFPTVIADVRVDGQQVPSARVYVDGALRISHLDGSPVELDPGAHKFRFEVRGFTPQEQDVVVSEGVQGRIVVADFHRDTRAPAPAPRSPPRRPVPPAVWVSGIVALAGVASTVVFGALAISEKNSLAHSCEPFCSDAQLGTLRGYGLAADVSVGVAAVASALAGTFFFTRPEEPPRSSVSVAPVVLPGNGGLLSARLFF